MPTFKYQILAQANPPATTEVLFYTCPGATQTLASTLMVCNQGNSPASFRVSISAGGTPTATTDYIYFDINMNPNDTLDLSTGIMMQPGDVMRVYASTSTMSFNFFGTEIT